MHGQLTFERVESFGGGVDGYNRATLLPPDVSQLFENVNVLDNLEARTRPGADKLGLAPSGGANQIQGLLYFDTPTVEQLIAGSNAKLYQWSTPFAAWTEMTGWTLPDTTLLLAAAQGVDKCLFSAGGTENMRSWDGAAFVDLGNLNAGIAGDPPVGATILCWHPTAGRMFASGKPTEDDTVWASRLLDFGKGKWDHTQFKFRVGGGEGDPVRAIGMLQDYNLAVLKENSAYIVVADPTATTAANWVIRRLGSNGCVGKRAIAPVGNDLLFMSHDGVRSIRRMAAAAGQYELSPPISEPMQPWIDRINWSYAHLINAQSYKHLVWFDVPLDSATTPNYRLTFNARLGKWIGYWTNWTVRCSETTRFGGVQRMVIGEQTGLVRQWKDFDDATDSDTYKEDGAAIPTKAWLRSMLFGQAINDKEAYDAELRFSASDSIVSVTLLGDNADLRSWQHDLRQTGINLPVNLPFDLVSPRAVTGRRGLRDLRRFNECFLKIESTSGWWSLRNVTVRAKLKKVPTQ